MKLIATLSGPSITTKNIIKFNFFLINANYRTFQPAICDDIDYHLKFSHQAIFEQLLQQKQGCDEIIIIKQGNVTDCSI